VKWSDIQEFYSKDTMKLARMAPKLTKLHLEVKDFSKMKVKLATQVFSQSVAAGIRTMVKLRSMAEDTLQTAEFVETVDELFDLLNILGPYNVKEFKSGSFLINKI